MNQSRPSQSKFRGWVLQLHLYGGLVCSSYLVLYGVSSLHFNHRYSFTEGWRETVSWTHEVTITDSGEDRAVGEWVRDELGLFGSVLPWTLNRDEADNLSFELSRPGKSYLMDTDWESGVVHVVERRRKVWAILDALHGGGRVPGSWLMTLWWLFTELTTVIVLFSTASGVYLWSRRPAARQRGWKVLALSTLGFVAFFLYLAG